MKGEHRNLALDIVIKRGEVRGPMVKGTGAHISSKACATSAGNPNKAWAWARDVSSTATRLLRTRVIVRGCNLVNNFFENKKRGLGGFDWFQSLNRPCVFLFCALGSCNHKSVGIS